ncbi:MAG: sigma-70 family RNA polymerase sigma factor [Candidatus Riflebacteria bacterium]|nr:sigma-70 family RNA polymerase sigma factor [Candidatus Riflebacteria bacterium]
MLLLNKEKESELIIQARCGQKDSFGPIVEKYWPHVHSVVRRACNISSADDMCQEIFIRAYSALNQFDTSRPFSPWIMKIAVNFVSEFLRKESKNNSNVSLDENYQGRLFGSQGERIVTKITIDELVEKLPLGLRIVFLLRHGAQLSYEEIAQILNEPLGTVKTSIFRAREMLRNWFDKDESAESSGKGVEPI